MSLDGPTSIQYIYIYLYTCIHIYIIIVYHNCIDLYMMYWASLSISLSLQLSPSLPHPLPFIFICFCLPSLPLSPLSLIFLFLSPSSSIAMLGSLADFVCQTIAILDRRQCFSWVFPDLEDPMLGRISPHRHARHSTLAYKKPLR